MIFKYIKAEPFFKHYAKNIKSHRHKIRGKNGRGNPTKFSDAENAEIKTQLNQLFADIKKTNVNAK